MRILDQFSKIEGGGGVSDPAAILFQSHAENFKAFIKSIESGVPFCD
jgi:hypothetical protein